MIAETANERPGADVDDGFATSESELAVYSNEAPERESKRLDQNSPRVVAKLIREAQHYRITQYSARAEAELTESTSESGTNCEQNTLTRNIFSHSFQCRT